MRRSRLSKENVGSSIPKKVVGKRRSSSLDCADRRGSYLPQKRNSSAERYRTPLKACATPRMSESFRRPSIGSVFIDRKPRVLKDCRPLTDKAHQRKCINSLIAFLSEKNFPYQITAGSLMSPQKRDYELIFQFLYNVLDPRYEVRRIEEEAPKLLKDLRYPFVLTKSSFLAVNRMSWPTLLGTLIWLMNYVKATCINAFGTDSEFDETDAQILVNYVLQSYKVGEEDADKEEEVFQTLCRQSSNINMTEQELKDRIAELQVSIDKEYSKQKEYEDLVEQVKEKEQTLLNYDEYFTKMKSHIQKKEAALKTTMEEHVEKEATLAELKKLESEKECLYKVQGFDGQNAFNFYTVQKRTWQEKLDEIQRLHKDEEKVVWDKEIELCQLNDRYDMVCKEFNMLWENFRSATDSDFIAPDAIRSLPPVAKLCRETKINIPEFKMGTRCEENVVPILEKVKNCLEQPLGKVQEIKAMFKRQILELETKMCDINGNLEITSTRLKEKERELETKSREGDLRIEALKSNLALIEEKLDDICAENKKKESDIGNLKESIEEMKINNAALVLKLEETKENGKMYIEKAKLTTTKLIKDSLECKSKTTEAVKCLMEKLKNQDP